jgi:hypothetical protein
MSTGENQQVEPQGATKMRRQPEAEPFKTCTYCSHVWPDRAAFLSDPKVVAIGYQAYSPDPVLGLFLFNHLECETTMALPAKAFAELYSGPIYRSRMSGTAGCLGHCDDQENLEPCPNECECAWVREVLQVVKGWQKQAQVPQTS